MIEIAEILYRWSKNLKIKEIARSLGYARNSVRSIIREAEVHVIKENAALLDDRKQIDSDLVDQIAVKISETRYSPKTATTSDIAPNITAGLCAYDERIIAWLLEPSMTITQIHRLIEESGYIVSETTVRRYIHHKFKSLINRGKNYTIPLFAAPGEEAQVDYAYVGLMKDKNTGKLRKTYAFVMTLSYSRYRYVEFTHSQDSKSWIQSHINAFKFFGGVPKTILIDNLKSGIITADIYDPTINRAYAELERFYGFVVDPTKVRTPEHKGKVERSVLIVKQQLIAGRVYQHLDEANIAAANWCKNIIANRITRTTGKTPAELFTQEQLSLLTLPGGYFDIAEWFICKVQRDHHLVFKGNFYSVPTCYIGYEVTVKGGLKTVEIYHENKLVKRHLRLQGKGNWQTDVNDYPESVLRFLNKTPELCITEAQEIGEATAEIIKLTLAKPSKQKLRKALAIIRLGDQYSKERLEHACFRAFTYENYSYETIRNCLEKNIEQLVPEESPMLKYETEYQGAYLRSASEYKLKEYKPEAHYG